MISQHLTQFAEHPVQTFLPDEGITDANVIYRISIDWDESDWQAKFEQFLADPKSVEAHGLVVGAWMGDTYDRTAAHVVDALVASAEKLPNLHALFIGDITYDENEISWINQADLGALFPAFPALTHFGARGGNGLRFGKIDHANLASFVVETGGLNSETLHDVLRSDLPNLTHLELYLGTEQYGGSVTLEDLSGLLTNNPFPKLDYLGLRDSEIVDDIAATIVHSTALLEQITTLDLSLGTLTDLGGKALLNAPAIRKLQKLDLHYHFMSAEITKQLAALPLVVDVGDAQDEERDWRFVAVGE